MSDTNRTVQMALVSPGSTHVDADFTFSMQPRFNEGRVVQYALIPSDAEALHKALNEFLKNAK